MYFAFFQVITGFYAIADVLFHDLEQMYFDSFLKIAALEDKDISAVVEKLERMSDFFQVDFILSVSRDESELPESVKDKIIVSL